MTAGFSDKSERALREALTSVARMEVDDIPPSLAALEDGERAQSLALALLATCYIMIDVCGNKWPNQASVREIAGDLATTTTAAEQMNLDAGKIYEYLWRAVLGTERVEDVLPDDPEFTLLPVIVMSEAIAVYCPKGMGAWDYLDHIESGIEVASALETWVLPAAVMRGYMRPAEPGEKADSALGQFPSGKHKKEKT